MSMWVFGYGSLLWKPGFDPVERVVAYLPDYRRSFCMTSIHHRGSEAEPGLVLALDPEEGAGCTGLALRVAEDEEEAVLAYLRERELVSSAYVEKHLDVELVDGRAVEALVYVMDPTHVQYCGGLPLEIQAQVIAHAHGGMGPNAEYLYNTAAHLEELGLADDELTWLAARVRNLRG
ncbi:ChaC-like protein [Pseudooceanicola marinus]|uniref:glutathione-specific gamma-glutamylcyclotransferase n=1 Tax=Pseudooceanicola marinus TaxID=396013 RepID=A0A1X6Z8R8_9RHOB|nr:gamma-glutamylcyclotransferase [Pseudooceanicola marinus]PJE32163.1 gamma-glutamylcyclotransferase [Pseudooceanicola marinus]SLN42145.1 ChaC-like protein [Pseudooceanicola marinus]